MLEYALLDAFKSILFHSIVILGIIVAPGLVTGFIISILQAATQINDMSLSFVPKLVVTIVVFALLSPWLFTYVADHVQLLYKEIPMIVN